ncbi:TlpA family protein disulfide reductase [Rubrobacter marinus]|uniref:TlpA family protein disulfide reductase n=1 Tax=Rubrobacter marinus TaxID=2653852 RepID=UPI00140E57C2|nr:TlpA disulfide reductase family protein [Rubrobacter marinus]
MKRLGLVLLVVLIAAGFYRSSLSEETATGTLTLPGPAPNVGEAAETFEARRQDGGSFELSDEGVYVLTFWSVFNRDSVAARPELAELAREYGDEGVSFAAVYIGGTPRDTDVPYTVLLDGKGELTSLYNVTRVPRSFLIEDGEVKLVQDGFLLGSEEQPGSGEQMEDELTRVLEERSDRAHGVEEKKRRA